MNNICLTDEEFVEFSHIYNNDICCGIEQSDENIRVRLIFADLMATLIKIKVNYICCGNQDCPSNPINELKSLMKTSQKKLEKYLYPKNINILNELINLN